jgi:hypothetical protein
MTDILLAWYPYPAPQGTSYYPRDLAQPANVVALFKQASRFRAHVTAEGWRYLFTRYGLEGLLDLNRAAGWFDATDEREAAEQLISRARIAGYEPRTNHVQGDFERADTLLVTY